MLKKIMLVVVAAVFLIGTESLFAAEKKKVEPKRQQVTRAPQQQRSRALQLTKEKADRETQAKRAEEMRRRALQLTREKAAREAQAKRAEEMRKKRQQEAAKKSATQSRVSRRPQQSRTGQNLLPMQQMFGKWLDEMNKAYRDNDRQKMGQLLRRMEQLNQRIQQAGTTAGRRWQESRDGRTGMERTRPGTGMSPRGMWGSGRGRGMMGRGGPCFQGRGMMGRGGPGGPGFPGRGMMDRGGPGFQGRGMIGRGGPDMPPGPDVKRPDTPPRPPKDAVRPEQPRSSRDVQRPDSSRSRRPGRFVPELKDAKPESRRPGSRND